MRTKWSAVKIESSCDEAFALARAVTWAISAVALCAGMVASGLKERFAVVVVSNCEDGLALAEEAGLVKGTCGLGMAASSGMG